MVSGFSWVHLLLSNFINLEQKAIAEFFVLHQEMHEISHQVSGVTQGHIKVSINVIISISKLYDAQYDF